MQVKKFEAPTLQEALDTIKRELGPEAIILQTKTHKRGFGLMSKGSVEVTAAVSDRSIQKKKVAEKSMPEKISTKLDHMPAQRQTDLYDRYYDRHMEQAQSTRDRVEIGSTQAATVSQKITSQRYIEIGERPIPKAPIQVSENSAVQDEIKRLKRMIEEMKSQQDTQLSSAMNGVSGLGSLMSSTSLNTPALQDVFEQLIVNGVDKRQALALMKTVGFELGTTESQNPNSVLDRLASEIMEMTLISEIPIGKQKIIALVGPTGVGKTTTLAKLASEAILKRQLKVGLINLDTYKVGAYDQLATYAKLLNVPFRSVSSVQDLDSVLSDFKSLDLILIDTTGRSQKDLDSLSAMKDVLDRIDNCHIELVLSATTRDVELFEMATRFAIFRPEGLILSKLDEATLYGAILNLGAKMKLPYTYFTTGQRVPEDIEQATKERVAALILDL